MAAIAIGMIYLPASLYLESSAPSRRTVTLPAANRHIGFGIANALDEHNYKVNRAHQMTQEERNMMLLDAYGERSSLEDMERALAGHEANMEMARAKHQRKGHWGGLHEAYGERKSLRDVERAMEFYEVQ